MGIERKLSVRVNFEDGGNLGKNLDDYQRKVDRLSRSVGAWRKEMEAVGALPVGNWLKAQEALKVQSLRSTFGLGLPKQANAFSFLPSSGGSMNTGLLKPPGAMDMASLASWANPMSAFQAMMAKAPGEGGSGTMNMGALKAAGAMDINKLRTSPVGRTFRQSLMDDLLGIGADNTNQEVQREMDDIRSGRSGKGAGRPAGSWFRGKRVFAGAGFGALGLLAGGVPESWGGQSVEKGLTGAIGGAGVASIAGLGPVGVGVAAASGAVFGVLKDAIEGIYPSAQKFKEHMGAMGEAMGKTDTILAGLARGEGPTAAGVDPVSAARIRAGGILGEPGEAEARLARTRTELERVRSGTGIGTRAEFERVRSIGFRLTDRAEEAHATAMSAWDRGITTSERSMAEGLRRGDIPGLIRPEIPGATGTGGVESITERITAALMEVPIAERTADATEEMVRLMTEWIRMSGRGVDMGLGAGLAAAMP